MAGKMNMLIFSDKNVFVLSENWITVDFGLPYLKDLYPNISNGSHSLERSLFFFFNEICGLNYSMLPQFNQNTY